eukprot:CAMPEP_0118657462 /NCGR_PEP_ID=MMETSP0785-20121206/14032_1 /TAXON_ID=91992 /ORGANISM="Bolidomonas pacifica, Strain CCMP 1866" /LENGTH=55 /DNA_ID=CAMNT_0006550383 /DNA_START=1465 /DNA_END=1632 /DNA_ORIENTATION=-
MANASPPSPVLHGSVTARIDAAVIEAATALPPWERIRLEWWVERGWEVEEEWEGV